jgi:hypothetical protein
MNYDLDDIRYIQTLLAQLPCGVCRRKGLVLLLRYNCHRGGCLFMAFCKACQMKHPITLDTAHRLNVQRSHVDDQRLHAQ